jgi:hypothetical protein
MAGMLPQGISRVSSSHRNTCNNGFVFVFVFVSDAVQQQQQRQTATRHTKPEEVRKSTPKEKASDFSLYSLVVMLSGLIHLMAPMLLLPAESVVMVVVVITRDRPRSDILPV